MSEADSPRQIVIGLANPAVGREGEFEEWYSGTHIPEILALEPFVAAQRYEIAEGGIPVGFRYATLYEVEGSAAAARDTIFGATFTPTTAQDNTQVFLAALAPIGERYEAGAPAAQ